MGWLFMSEMRSKSQLIAHLTGPGNGLNTLAKCLKGSTLWAVQAPSDRPGQAFIACYLLGADQGAWGYKDMTESCGPVQNSCPVKYFDLVPDPGGFATAWRERCRARTASMAQAAKSLQVGAVVKLKPGLTMAGEPVTEATIESVRPLIGRVGLIFQRSVSLKRAWIA